MTKSREKLRSDIMQVMHRAIDAVDPGRAIADVCSRRGESFYVGDHEIPLSAYENVYVLGAGKASALMARAMERIIGDRIRGGLISTRSGYQCSLEHLEIIEAGHPIPDRGSVSGARSAIQLAQSAVKGDLVVALISGGASALWALPCEGMTLEDKISVTRTLLDAGADIHEMNCVRKHISAIKGGRLAKAAHPADVITLLVSDVVGDEPSSIGSGPTVPDRSTYDDAVRIVEKYRLDSRLPESVLNHLRKGREGEIEETPKPGELEFQNDIVRIAASNLKALMAAEEAGREIAYNTSIISTQLTGEARIIGRGLAEIAKKVKNEGVPVAAPAMLIWGGETTVTVRGKGKGGRNQELVLAAAMEIDGVENIAVASVGTDGVDGPTDAAGAVADGQTVKRGKERGMRAAFYLDGNDSYRYFDLLNDLIRTGPTGTNVMDIQVFAIGV